MHGKDTLASVTAKATALVTVQVMVLVMALERPRVARVLSTRVSHT